jgi:hypothetical protein
MWQSPGFVAGDTIYPGRVVYVSGPFQVKQVGAGEENKKSIIGIAATIRRRPQGFTDADKAALVGEPIRVYTNGEIALAHAQANVVAGDVLVAHSDGRVKPLPGAPGQYMVVGVALHNASADEYVRIYVKVEQVTV